MFLPVSVPLIAQDICIKLEVTLRGNPVCLLAQYLKNHCPDFIETF